ncbi:MAG: DUF1800 family protein [Gammaproteobacteria bacterium]|nr:DUF1800 family protein [Gammaproteobacteria bacterium]
MLPWALLWAITDRPTRCCVRDRSRWQKLISVIFVLPMLWTASAASAAPLTVTVKNAIDGTRLSALRLDAYRLDAGGKSKWMARANTDGQGVARLDIAGLDSGATFVLRAKPYGVNAYSQSIKRSGSVVFPVGKLRINVKSGATGQPLRQTRVDLREVLADGKTKWALRGETDSAGIVHFDPSGLGAGRKYVAKVRSALTGDWKQSAVFAAGGMSTFLVGNKPLTVTLQNGIDAKKLAGQRVDAYRLEGSERKWVARGETNPNGQVVFDLDGLGSGEKFVLKARPYGSSVQSAPISKTGAYPFKVGNLRLVLKAGSTGAVLGDTRVDIYEQASDGKLRWLHRGNSDASGVAHLDPAAGSGATLVARVKSPVSGANKTSQALRSAGKYTFVVGNEALNVTLKNAISGRAVANSRIDAYVVSATKRRWAARTTTDSKGHAVFDLDGLGDGVQVVLRAKPYGTDAWSDTISKTGAFEFAVGKLQLTMVDSAGKVLPSARVDVREVKSDGSTKWVLRGSTDAKGQANLDPVGLGSGRQFVLQAASPVTGKRKTSAAISKIGPYRFKVGNEALRVALVNALTNEMLPGQRIDAFENVNGARKWVARAETDASGIALFDIDNLGSGREVVLKSRPYGVSAYSDPIKTAGALRFPVGRLQLTVVSGADGTPLADHKVYVRELLSTGKTKWVQGGSTDAKGVARFDPLGLGSGRKFVAMASSPLNGSRKTSEPYVSAGAYKFVVGNAPLKVRLVDGISGRALAGVKVSAVERIAGQDSTKWRDSRKTDSSGNVVFDLDGLGSGRVYALYSSPYNGGRVWSADFKTPQSYQFKVGTSPVTLFDIDERKPMPGIRLVALKQDAAGKLRWFRSATTDGQGIVRFDLPGVSASSPYVMKAYSPFGNGKRFYSSAVTSAGPFLFNLSRTQDPDFDGESPTIVVRAPAAGAIVAASGFQVTGVASDNKSVSTVAVDVGEGPTPTTIMAVLDSNTGAFSANVGAVTPGAVPITIRATDAAGNIGTTSLSVHAVADSGAPVITITSHSNNDTVASTGFRLAGTATDDIGVTTLTLTVVSDGQQTIAAVPVSVSSTGAWSFNVGSGAIGQGAVQVSMTAADDAGNASSAMLSLGVVQSDPSIRQLIDRITFGATPELIQSVTNAADFLNEQLNPSTIDDSALASILPSGAPSDRNELQERQIYYAVASRRQLLEVMTWFWDNHFSTSINSRSDGVSNTVAFEWAENQAFRANALGRFRDLLEISAKSPAMSIYLNGNSNVVGNPNENYPRELMELHTLKVDGGYTDQDIEEVARVFTGWQFNGSGQFVFNASQHDFGAKTVLGVNIPAGMQNGSDGERVLDILAEHPSTARFICEKLIRLFVTDVPEANLVGQCAQTFSANATAPDQMARVVRSLIESAEFQDPENARSKIKNPLELAASVVRNFGATGDLTDLRSDIRNMGMALFDYPVPTGVPEVGDKWINSTTLLERMKFVDSVAFSSPSNSRLGLNPVAFFTANGVTSGAAIVDFVFDVGMNGDATALERNTALSILNDGGAFDINAPDAEAKLRALLGVVLSFPAYQQH